MSITYDPVTPEVMDVHAARVSAAAHNPARRGAVLLATDGTESSPAQAILASELASQLGAPLHVVTVMEPSMAYEPRLDLAPYPPSEEDLLRAREGLVRHYVSDAIGTSRVWELEVRYGRPVHEIARVARSLDASLIAVGATPHRRFSRIVSGVRAFRLLQVVSAPVLSVAPGRSSLPRRILAAVDFSPSSIFAMQAALLMAGDGARLTLLHVADPMVFRGSLPGNGHDSVPDEIQQSFERLLAELSDYAPADLSVDTHVISGDALDEILSFADASACDLISVGTRGRSLIDRALLGSVAAGVLHRAGCNVLAAPEPSGAEAMRLRVLMQGDIATSDPEEWEWLLREFSRRNDGRTCQLEMDDSIVGARILARGFLFRGAQYDSRTGRVNIMLGGPSGVEQHYTRSVSDIDSMAIMTTGARVDWGLEMMHGRGHTVLVLQE